MERRSEVVNLPQHKLSFVQASEENEEQYFYYREIFRKSAKRVVVMFRIYNAMKQCAVEVNIFQFYENEESRLYRRFLNNWKGYWHKKQGRIEKKIEEKIQNKVFFAKTKKYVVCNAECEEDDDMLNAVNRLKQKRKAISLGKWEKLIE